MLQAHSDWPVRLLLAYAAEVGQAAQPAAATVPLPVTAPKKPGAHVVQAATDQPPKRPGVEMPTGQAVQLVAPAAA